MAPCRLFKPEGTSWGSSIGSVMSSSTNSSSNRTEHIREKQILNQHNIDRLQQRDQRFNTKLNDDLCAGDDGSRPKGCSCKWCTRQFVDDESVKYALRQPTKPQSSVVAGIWETTRFTGLLSSLIKKG